MPVALCFFLSGAAALILQVLWTRMLGHVFGATALAISTTLTVFMGGLALGSHWGGKYAPRLKRPILAFAALESAVGFYGLLVPGLLDFLPAIQRAIGGEAGLHPALYAVVRFVAVTLILIIPTTAMGATLPVLAEGVVKAGDHMASRVGRLYAANTAGAVVGAFSAGFVLIPKLGLHQTVLLAAGIDLLVAVVVLALFGWGGEGVLIRRRREESPDEILNRLEPVVRVPVIPLELKRVLLAFAFSGGAAMVLEVLWSRAVGVVIGASTYSFTLILTTFLVGLAAGAAYVSRRVERWADPLVTLAKVELAVGATASLATLFIDRLPLWLHASARSYGVTMTDIYLTQFGITAAVTLPTTLCLGAVMPLVVRILAPDGETHAGPIVGRAYALNTLGAIVGSFAGGFIVLPLLGVEWGLRVACLLSAAVGVLLIWERPLRKKFLGAALAVATFIVLAPRWDVNRWTAGLFRMYLARSVYKRGWAAYGEIIYHKDGVATSVTVERHESGSVALKVNGKVDASDVGDMPTQVLSGLLPVMFHPNPKRALVIGYGSGVTPGALLQADLQTVHVAEIESAVYEAANAYFGHVNNRPDKNPRATLFVDDGRNFLLTRGGQYDIIISEPSNPWMSGASSLFTQDFFRIASRRLADDGIFLQWLQLYEISPSNVHALMRTFQSVFPEVLVFSPDPASNDTFLIGSKKPLSLDLKRVATLLKVPAIAAELTRAKIRQPEDFVGLFLLGTRELPGMVGEGPYNTDDNALIEFSAPKDLLTYSEADPKLPFLKAIQGRRREMLDRHFSSVDTSSVGLGRIAHALLGQGRLDDAKIFIEEARAKGGQVERLARIYDYAEGSDDFPVLVASAATKSDADYARAAKLMLDGKDRDALAAFDGLDKVEDRSLAHRFLYAFLCYRRDRLTDADYLMDAVLADEAFVQMYPSALFYAGKIQLYRGRYPDALTWFEKFDAVQTSTRAIER